MTTLENEKGTNGSAPLLQTAGQLGGARMSLVDEAGGGLDGLSQLRALIASGRKPGILVPLDFQFRSEERRVGKEC